MGLQTGWIEKRESERKEAAWEVTYQVISADEAAQLCKEHLRQEAVAAPGDAIALTGARTHDVSAKGLAVVGPRSLASGTKLLLYIHPPRQDHSLVVVAEVVHCVLDASQPAHYRSGMRILAVDQPALDQILKEL